MDSYTLKNGLTLKVVINSKNIKNMYLRIKNNDTICISAPKWISNKKINDFIKDNEDAIIKILNKRKDNIVNSNELLFKGKKYEIIYIKQRKVIFTKDKVYLSKSMNIKNFYKKEAEHFFLEHFISCYNRFEEKIVLPKLKIRNMKSKWGVCNVTRKEVTLNLELIKYDYKYLDYVIIHELSHLMHANHSKDFWALVEKYCKDYKLLRKDMRNFTT